MVPTALCKSPQAAAPEPAADTSCRESSAVTPAVCSTITFAQQGSDINMAERFSLYYRKIAGRACSHLPVGCQLPTLQKHLDIVCDLAREQIGDTSCLNDESVYSMASGLCTAEINTLDEAHKLGLVIVPPGPVFHTWYALHGTTLFNGENYFKGYNYVKTIEKEADFLREFQLPVLLVYSILKMTAEQIQEMSRLFKEHNNIISICLETDFPGHELVRELERKADLPTERCDAIRFITLKYKDEVLNTATEKAKVLW